MDSWQNDSTRTVLKRRFLLITIVFLCLIFGYGGFKLISLSKNLNNTKNELVLVREGLESRIAILENRLLGTETVLTTALKEAQDKSGELLDEIGNISSTVGDLEKLSKIDNELLQKYSKVYFLNEHYEPTNLRVIPRNLLSDESKTLSLNNDVLDYLKDMIADAKEDGIDIRILSAFRSFEEQNSLKSKYTVTYGAGTANQFSADQGYSEHQLGTTVDLNTPEMGLSLDGFDKTEAYKWLTDNAYKFGFVLSYPPNNAYYVFEPWHWRFVGIKLARYLDRNNKFFYDLDQRKIDEYLIDIFD